MRIQVQIASECITIGIAETETLDTLANEAQNKLAKLKPTLLNGKSNGFNGYVEIRKTIGGSLLDPEDAVGQVLNDGDFVMLVLLSDLAIHQNDTAPHPILSSHHMNINSEAAKKLLTQFEVGADQMHRYPNEQAQLLVLDGNSLRTEDLIKCERGLVILQLSLEAEKNIVQSRRLLEQIVEENKIVYGVSTGFGIFSNTLIEKDKLYELQENLIRSHATGIGNALSPSRVLALLALRINILAKGYSGISLENVRKMVAAYNAFCVSYVPEQGTVGCSGDLCPLAHLALGLMGEGKMWSSLTGWADANEVLKLHQLTPLKLGPKEGIALINGTQMVSAIGALTVERACAIAHQADVIAALTLDVLKGTTKAYDPDVHQIRPHKGQIATARRLRALLHSDKNPSLIAESHRYCNRVQDAYTLRCVPQVHGIVHDTIEFVRNIINIELNAATDNPLVFVQRNETISAGNFHGEYPAKALDYLAIGVHELAQMSERRLERLVNPNLSGLPTFLTPNGGLNSGFMTIQLCAASLVSENKVLCHPSSVDSIPTSCNQEDHVSMGGFSARKAAQIVEHVEAVLAMELLAACQGMEFLKPLTTTAPLQKVYNLVRTVSKPLERDRFMQPDIEAVIQMLRENKIWKVVEPHIFTTKHLEEIDPTLLRHDAKSPTGTIASENDTNEPEIKRNRFNSDMKST